MRDALRYLGQRDIDFGLEAGYIELGCSQQRTQLIVQLSRQMTTLVFAYLLQVGGKLGQSGRAFAHDFFQTIAFIALYFLLSLVRLVQRAGLAQVHEKSENA